METSPHVSRADRGNPSQRPGGRDASKGCRICARRRIICDLGRPSCQKCIKKGLECPGYGRRLRWVGGGASRGHLSATTSISTITPSKPESSVSSTSSFQGPTSQQTHDDKTFAVPLCLPPELEARAPSADFVSYYSSTIAGLMVWLDSEENEYRRRVLPLAELNPGLRLAVAAISSQHVAVTAGQAATSSSPPSFSALDFPEAARDACLAILQKSAGDLTLRMTSGADLNTGEDVVNAECMLASMLMMTCYEMARSRVEAAECHRRAARTIVGVFGETEGARRSRVFTFLRNQLSIHDVLAATTSFDAEDLMRVIVPARGEQGEDQADLFTEYLALLHHVILSSRGISFLATDLSASGNLSSMDKVRAAFEQARASTLMAATRLRLDDARVRRDFVRLVETYHNTALLYSHQCLATASSTTDPVSCAESTLLSACLTKQLVEFEDETAWIQNLPWPALVAGFGSHGIPSQQTTISRILLEVFKATNSRHHMDTLDFLRAFWVGPNSDWRPQAKAWEDAGRRIIPV